MRWPAVAMLAGWLLADYQPGVRAAPATALVPVCLAVIAVTMGLAATTGNGGTFLVIYGAIATLAAAGDTGLTTALAVTAAGIVAIEVGGARGRRRSALPSCSAAASGAEAGGFMVRAATGPLTASRRSRRRCCWPTRERLQGAEQRRADLLDERARIAREIHDVLAHSLGALGIQIQAARSVLTDRGDVAMAIDLLAAAQRMASEGLVETRRAIALNQRPARR